MKRRSAVRTPAGYAPLSELWPWIVGAGTVIVCARCRAEAIVPNPRTDATGYTRACEQAIEQHKRCTEAKS